jgi:hypothetical protein
MNTVHVTQVGDSPCDHHVPFTVRGRNKGEKAKPTKCRVCGEEIAIGEQYFRIDDWMHVCLGCAKYS